MITWGARLSFLCLALFLYLRPTLAHARSVGTIRAGGESDYISPWNFHTWGSYKSIAAVTYLRQEGLYPKDTSPFAEQRFRFAGSLSRDWFRFEFANQLNLMTQVANDPYLPVPSFNPTPAFNTETLLYSSSSVRLTNLVDRAFVHMQLDPVEITIGKQVIGMGVGHIFSAVSQVPRLPFVIVDSEFPFTEDAITLSYVGPLVVQARFLPKVSGQQGHNFHLRLGESTPGYDFVMTMGQSDDKMFLGLEAAKNLGGFVLRGEFVGYEFERDGRFQGLLGIDRAFTAEFGLEAELFYNGFGADNSLYYQIASDHRSSPYKGQWYAGLKINATLHPLVRTSLVAVNNLNDASTLLNLSVTYSLSDDLELLFGQYLSVHSDPYAEYGGSFPVTPTLASGIPDLTYLLLKLHF